MKKILIGLSSISLLALTSCNEDRFLNTEPTETISTPPVKAKLYGLYVMMINTGTGGTIQHEDFGQKGVDIITDLLSSDMALAYNAYNRYFRLANLTATTNSGDLFNYIPWRYYYRLIKGANDIINDLGENGAMLTNENKHLLGQAKALRAYGYFYLLQLYTQDYNPNEESIPLYLGFGLPAAPKSKQSEVYAAIVKDLKESIDLLQGFNRENKGMIDKNVAKGLLAYTYAAMNENQLAANIAKEIINSGLPTTTKEEVVRYTHDGTNASGGGFNNLNNNKSWMWGFDITTENKLDLVSWWGQMDVFTYSYQNAGDIKQIDVNLYNSINSDDIRKHQFVGIKSDKSQGKDYEIVSNTDPDAHFQYIPANKFFPQDRVLGGQREVTTDYVFMRTDEFHLLAAETLAKSGNETEAKTILKNYLTNRISNISYIDSLSGQNLLDEIYKNTRIEFWGEGKSYLAMKRNKATVIRGDNHQYSAGSSFSYNDDKLSLKIPQQEILNNPYITK